MNRRTFSVTRARLRSRTLGEEFETCGVRMALSSDQSGLLVQLITETVARGEWAIARTPPGQAPLGGGMAEDDAPILSARALNSLYYYPPARALVW